MLSNGFMAGTAPGFDVVSIGGARQSRWALQVGAVPYAAEGGSSQVQVTDSPLAGKSGNGLGCGLLPSQISTGTHSPAPSQGVQRASHAGTVEPYGSCTTS